MSSSHLDRSWSHLGGHLLLGRGIFLLLGASYLKPGFNTPSDTRRCAADGQTTDAESSRFPFWSLGAEGGVTNLEAWCPP